MTDSIFEKWHQSGVWASTTYKGVFCQQSPCDLWALREIVFATKPTAIICTGVGAGGTALYLLDLMEGGLVVGIDVNTREAKSSPGLVLIEGNSAGREAVEQAKELTANRRRMVVLDSDHTKQHVLAELAAYAPLVAVGCYLLVEDTCIGSTACLDFGPGPAEALAEWLPHNRHFVQDFSQNRWGLSQHPGGFLVRTR